MMGTPNYKMNYDVFTLEELLFDYAELEKITIKLFSYFKKYGELDSRVYYCTQSKIRELVGTKMIKNTSSVDPQSGHGEKN